MREYDDGPDDTHEKCLSEYDLDVAREEGWEEGRCEVASRVEAILGWAADETHLRRLLQALIDGVL